MFGRCDFSPSAKRSKEFTRLFARKFAGIATFRDVLRKVLTGVRALIEPTSGRFRPLSGLGRRHDVYLGRAWDLASPDRAQIGERDPRRQRSYVHVDVAKPVATGRHLIDSRVVPPPLPVARRLAQMAPRPTHHLPISDDVTAVRHREGHQVDARRGPSTTRPVPVIARRADVRPHRAGDPSSPSSPVTRATPVTELDQVAADRQLLH
jgi:hypothetical protein